MMTKLEALQASIDHWEANIARIATGDRLQIGTEHCALCSLYFNQEGQPDVCLGCPVKEATGKGGCAGTPYMPIAILVRKQRCGIPVYKYDLISACEEEVAFLRSLLPGVQNDTP